MKLTILKLMLLPALTLSFFAFVCGDSKNETNTNQNQTNTQTQQQNTQTQNTQKKTDSMTTKTDSTDTKDKKDSKESNIVVMKTSMGEIEIELLEKDAPLHVANFKKLVKSGFYEGTTFHRVIAGFMIQGGGMTEGMSKKTTLDPVKNEAYNGLKNLRGTVAMARTMDPHSATAQFFINTVDNGFLDFKGQTATGWGYCVFGKVIKGMEVVDAIEQMPTTKKEGHSDVPRSTVVLKKAIEIK